MTITNETRSADNTATLLGRIDGLSPIIDAQVEQAEVNCQLDDSVYAALAEGGFMGLLVPSAFGGQELDLADAARVIIALAEVDGATAWNLNQSAAVSASVSWYDDAYQTAYADPTNAYAGVFWPPSPVEEVDGGLRVLSVRLPFASCSAKASWFEAFGMLTENGEPIIDAETGAPIFRGMLIPMDEVGIDRTWNPVGMRATGSDDALIENVFVPNDRIVDPFVVLGRDKPAELTNPLYAMGPWVNTVLHASVPLGIARGIVAGVTEIAKEKTPNFFETPLREKASVRFELARAQARVNAAEAYLTAAAADAQAATAEHGEIPMDQRVNLQLAASFVVTASTEAIDRAAQVGGTSTIKSGGPLERKVRDLRTIIHHVTHQEARYEDAGAVMLGQMPAWLGFAL